jgi:tetratricopeptide (TPR) repeat protein
MSKVIIIVLLFFCWHNNVSYAAVAQLYVKQYVKIMQNQALYITKQNIGELVQDLFIQSVIDSILGENEKAYEALIQALKLDPANACLHYKLSQVLHKLPHLSNRKRFVLDSYTHIYASIELSSTTKLYYYTAITMHTNSGQYHEASVLYEAMFQHFEPTCQDLWNLAHLYIEQKDYKQAIRVYSQLEQKIGVTKQVVKEKHNAFLAMNEIEMAISDSMKMASQYPENEDYILLLSNLLIQNEQSDLALQYLKAHVLLYDFHTNALYYLIKISLDYRNPEEVFNLIKTLFACKMVSLDKKLEILEKYSQSVSSSYCVLDHTKLTDTICAAHPNSFEVYNACANLCLLLGYQDKYIEYFTRAKQIKSS